MATLYIAEYENLAFDGQGRPIAAGEEPAIARQVITSLSSTSQASSAFNKRTRFVLLSTDAACFVLFGEAPTALTTSQPLFANNHLFFGIKKGAANLLKVAARTA